MNPAPQQIVAVVISCITSTAGVDDDLGTNPLLLLGLALDSLSQVCILEYSKNEGLMPKGCRTLGKDQLEKDRGSGSHIQSLRQIWLSLDRRVLLSL